MPQPQPQLLTFVILFVACHYKNSLDNQSQRYLWSEGNLTVVHSSESAWGGWQTLSSLRSSLDKKLRNTTSWVTAKKGVPGEFANFC